MRHALLGAIVAMCGFAFLTAMDAMMKHPLENHIDGMFDFLGMHIRYSSSDLIASVLLGIAIVIIQFTRRGKMSS